MLIPSICTELPYPMDRYEQPLTCFELVKEDDYLVEVKKQCCH